MTELTKLEAGKTYVFNDEDAKKAWLSKYPINKLQYDSFYNNGFTLEHVYKGIQGEIGQRIVIGSDELKYFKLKGEETMQQPKHLRPEDEVTITTTYGELADILIATGCSSSTYGTEDLYMQLLSLFKVSAGDLENLFCGLPSIVVDSEIKICLNALLFPEPTSVESPTQRKARELREQAEELLAKARELEEGM